MNFSEAENLHRGQTLYHVREKNSDGSALRVRVNGRVRTWRRSPGKIQIPTKYGMYDSHTIDERELGQWTLEEPERVVVKRERKKKESHREARQVYPGMPPTQKEYEKARDEKYDLRESSPLLEGEEKCPECGGEGCTNECERGHRYCLATYGASCPRCSEEWVKDIGQ